MAKRWEQITTKCLHHLNDLGLLAEITLIDSSVLALQHAQPFLTPFLHWLYKQHCSSFLRIISLSSGGSIGLCIAYILCETVNVFVFSDRNLTTNLLSVTVILSDHCIKLGIMNIFAFFYIRIPRVQKTTTTRSVVKYQLHKMWRLISESAFHRLHGWIKTPSDHLWGVFKAFPVVLKWWWCCFQPKWAHSSFSKT